MKGQRVAIPNVSSRNRLTSVQNTSRCVQESAFAWVLVKGFNLGYHNKETILFTIGPYSGNLN